MKAHRAALAAAYLALAVLALSLWHQRGDLPWAIGASGFALASIRESLLLIREIVRQ